MIQNAITSRRKEVLSELEDIGLGYGFGLSISPSQEMELDRELDCGYWMSMELSDEIRKMQGIKRKAHSNLELDGDERRFCVLYGDSAELLMCRGSAFGNMGRY